ncbi:MAG: DNA polymerase III subunit gamma/tau [Persephonella sp.]|nr:MAG: DNA polymerase III subunit gamma/tau [Persephonella sp.]
MSYYEPFSRKYRPKNFDEVIGQESVVRTLRNAIKLNRISNAYIFAGSRGLGKTTISRILTKCLNCEVGITDKPCGKCENCIEIDKGSFPDMYEIDAASNRGIDDIRNIKENVGYAPIKGRYKVYIIDEAHMLTREAFNALLKTLEEPPPHNIFILATTELHKIPDTIRSRCQTFIFKSPNKSEIVKYLKRICESERIEYEEKALEILAEASEGGMRDSASLLDQATVFGEGKITVKSVEEMLGFIPVSIIDKFFNYLKNKDIKNLITVINSVEKSGYDLNIFWKQIIEELHNILVDLTLGKDNKYFTTEDIKELIYIQTIFNKALIEAKNFPNPKHIYQLAVLKLKYLNNIVSIKELLEKGINITTKSKDKNLKEIELKEDNGKKSLDYILKEVKSKLGGVVYSILKSAKIEEREDSFIVFVNKSLVKTLDTRELSNIFGKAVKIEPLEEKVEKKEDKKDESVEKVLELFKGKIISYKKKNN